MDRFQIVQNRFGEAADSLDTVELFHAASQDLRDPYLTYVYELGRTQKSLRWWISSSAQKNSYICKTFHHICYLKVGLELIRKDRTANTLVLIVEDQSVRLALRLNLKNEPDVKATIIEPLKMPGLRSIGDTLNMLLRRGFFILRESYQVVQSFRYAPRLPASVKPITLLMSYVTTDTVRRGGHYHETYYGALAERLTQLGRQIVLIPIILKDVGQKNALHQLGNAKYPILVPHRYLTFWDVVRAAISTIIGPPLPSSIPTINGIDVSPLFKAEIRYFWKSNRAADTMLMAALINRLAKSGFSIVQIIYIYENQPWERAFCWETRRLYPGTVLTGYQHARVPMLLLNFYQATGGEPEAPQPDWVVTVGESPARQMLNGGHANSKIRVGGAIQMEELQTMRAVTDGLNNKDRPIILITPSNGPEEAAELVYMAVNLFSENDGIKVILKCHPLTPFDMINFAVDESLPAHVELSDQPVTELMLQSTMMIYSGSTVGIQALTLGLPLIHLRPQFDFDLDPLETVPEVRLEASGLEDLRTKVLWLLDNREEYVIEHQQEWQRLAEDFYGPVTEKTFLAFI